MALNMSDLINEVNTKQTNDDESISQKGKTMQEILPYLLSGEADDISADIENQ